MSPREQGSPPGKATTPKTAPATNENRHPSSYDDLYAELRHGIEDVPFDVLVDMVCGGCWCEDSFPCPACQRGSDVPSCTAQGDQFCWQCFDRTCGASGNRADLERILLDETRTVAEARNLLSTIRAVTS